jgi:hypothetical protein
MLCYADFQEFAIASNCAGLSQGGATIDALSVLNLEEQLGLCQGGC